jgi:Leucine Rich Repeat
VDILRLTGNALTGIPPPFSRLQVLDLSVNRFHGGLPTFRYDERSIRPNLIHMNVSHNLFNGTVLQELIRESDDFESPYYVDWPELQVLDMSYCSFSGAIVGEVVAPLSNLEIFRLNNNYFTGSLPSGLRLLTALSEFSAGGNQLEGTFPWTHLSSAPLQRLEMSNNQFTGDFLPPSTTTIGSLSLSLEYLDFSRNNFGASIPESIGQLSQLQSLLLAENGITGTLPSALGDLLFLRTLDLSQNSLMGTLPSELANCGSLEELVLNDNMFSGTIPQGYAEIPHLGAYTLQPLILFFGVGFIQYLYITWLTRKTYLDSLFFFLRLEQYMPCFIPIRCRVTLGSYVL